MATASVGSTIKKIVNAITDQSSFDEDDTVIVHIQHSDGTRAVDVFEFMSEQGYAFVDGETLEEAVQAAYLTVLLAVHYSDGDRP